MQVSSEFIQSLKDKVNLSEILGRNVKLVPAGNMRYKGLCPFHNEKTPSFTVSDDKKAYHCFGCGAHGDVFSYLQEKEGYNFVDALEFIADYVGVKIDKTEFKSKERIDLEIQEFAIIEKFNKFFKSELEGNERIKKYAYSRKMDEKIQEEFSLGFSPDKNKIQEFVKSNGFDERMLLDLGLFKEGSYGSYFLFSERLIFPIHNHQGKMVAFGGRIMEGTQDKGPKYINSPEHKFFKKRELLYNFHRAKLDIQKSKQVIVCEGYMDVIAMHIGGFKNVVAPLGTSFSEEHLKFLWRYVDVPMICLDGDEAGQRACKRIANLAMPLLTPGKSLNFVVLPSGQDPDDLLKEVGGKRRMQGLIQSSNSLAKVILQQFLTAKNLTPELKAKTLEDLKKTANSIPDKNVGREYNKYFTDSFYEFFRNPNFKNVKKTSGREIRKNVESGNLPSAIEMDLICFALSNLSFVRSDEIEEEFSRFEFESVEIDGIRSFILSGEAGVDKWMSDNISQNLQQKLVKKAKTYASENQEELRLKQIWLFLTKSLSLGKLKADFALNMNSDIGQKQEIADSLKLEIEKISSELVALSEGL
jgi:DNA primase